MATSGPNSPSTIVSDSASGTFDWTSPGNAASSNNSYAIFSCGYSNDYSYFLKATDFGFSIPAGATINGIAVDIERKADWSDIDGYAVDILVSLIKNGEVQTTNRGDDTQMIPTDDSYRSFGGVSDLWGTSWDRTDINATNFGVCYQVETRDSGGYIDVVSVDHIRITITYSLALGPAIPVLMNQYRQRRQ